MSLLSLPEPGRSLCHSQHLPATSDSGWAMATCPELQPLQEVWGIEGADVGGGHSGSPHPAGGSWGMCCSSVSKTALLGDTLAAGSPRMWCSP